jgi:hypothetical protein
MPIIERQGRRLISVATELLHDVAYRSYCIPTWELEKESELSK